MLFHPWLCRGVQAALNEGWHSAQTDANLPEKQGEGQAVARVTELLRDRNLLASEYQAMYRDAAVNLRFAYGIDHSDLFRPSCVFGPGFREKLDDLGFVQCGMSADDGADPAMVRVDRIERFA